MTPDGIEREIKLLATESLAVELVRAIALEQGFLLTDPRFVQQTDTYLDSARGDLRAAGVALRCRRSNGHAMLALKQAQRTDGDVVEREEIEVPWHGPMLPRACEELPEPIRSRTEPFLYRRELLPELALTTARTSQELRHDDPPARAELCVDRVVIGRAESATAQTFTEVEIELEQGPVDPFLGLARELTARLPLVKSPVDKLQRARTLNGGAQTLPQPAAPVLEPRMSVREAAFAVFRHWFTAMQRHEPGTRLAQDVEDLHDMRVATRRMRSAIRLFAPLFDDGYLDPTLEVIRQHGRALGPGRDLDVLMENVGSLRPLLPADLRAAVESFVQVLANQRRAEQARLVQWLQSPERLASTQRVQEFLAQGPRGHGSALEIWQVAPGLLLRAARRVWRRGRRIGADAAPEQYHELRIRLKRLRYAGEIFQPVYGRHLGEVVSRATDLQRTLGTFNDGRTAVAQLSDWLRGDAARLLGRGSHGAEGSAMPARSGERAGMLAPGTSLAVAALIGLAAARSQQALREFPDAWQRFDRRKLRRRLREELIGRW